MGFLMSEYITVKNEYADEITDPMMNAVAETNRRREIQQRYNEENGIVPKTIRKEVRDVFDIVAEASGSKSKSRKKDVAELIDGGKASSIGNEDRQKMIERLTREMKSAAKELDFERAAELRDIIITLSGD